jgi:hypothetical protein
VAPAIVPHINEAGLTKGGSLRYLRNAPQMVNCRVTRTLEASAAEEAEVNLLHVPAGAPAARHLQRRRAARPITQLTKVYVEPTNACNIACRTCIRNNWDENLGRCYSMPMKASLAYLRLS